MSEKTTGGIWIMISRFGWLALQILSLPIYVRTLGESNYGAAILITNIRAFWQILDLSAPQGILQLLSKTFKVDEPKAWRYFRTGLGIQAIVGLLGFSILWLAPYILTLDKSLLGQPGLEAMCLISGFQFFFDSFGSTYNLPFIAREQFKKVAAFTSVLPSVTVVVTIILVLWLKSPVALILGTMLDSFAQCVIRFYVIRKYESSFPLLPNFEPKLAKEIIQLGLKSYVTDLSTRIGSTMDKLIIGAVLGKEILAIYNLACRIPQVLLETFSKLSTVMQPEMTHVAHNEPERFNAIFKRNFAFVGAIAVCGIVLTSGFGHVIGQAWMRKSYPDFGTIVFLMGVYYALEMHHSTITVGFFSKEKAHFMLPFTLWNSCITVACTKYFATHFGLTGVASMNLLIDLAQIIPIHWYATRYILNQDKSNQVTVSELLKTTALFFGTSIIISGLCFFAIKSIPLGWLNYVILLLIPILSLLLGSIYVRNGWVQLPLSIESKLKRITRFATFLKLA
jgi:O-antigen/teichoic acid export membrane protein